jgi:hypothetical protein
MTDDGSLADLLESLYEHLAATAELPVTRESSAYVGEAEAVARDLARRDAPDDVVEERVGHVRDLLAEVDGTGHDEADDHVSAAADTADEVLDRLDG